MNNAFDPLDPAHAQTLDPLLRRIRAALRARDAAQVVPSLDAARADLSDRLRHDADRTNPKTAVPHRVSRSAHRGLASLLGFAALCLVIVGVVTHRSGAPRASVHTYATTAAQQTTVALANGSRAILGPATTLSVETRASDGAMIVTLVGQALFTVAHESRAPFIVRVNRTAARVLGTSFFVREYAADRAARVAVVDGRVSVRDERREHGHETAILSRGALAVVGDSGPMVVTPAASMDAYTAWATGRLVFHDTPVADIVAELSRTYDADIRVADSALARSTMTWSVLVGRRSLSGVLDVLSVTLNAHVVREGRTITIVPGRRASQKTSTPPSFSQEPQYGR